MVMEQGAAMDGREEVGEAERGVDVTGVTRARGRVHENKELRSNGKRRERN